MAGIEGGHRHLTRGLGGAVDADGSDRVVLAVGPVKPAIEDVVRRDLDQGKAAFRGGLGQ